MTFRAFARYCCDDGATDHVRNPSRLYLRFFSKAARQNPERKAWVRGYGVNTERISLNWLFAVSPAQCWCCAWGGDWVFDVNSPGPKFVSQGAGSSHRWRHHLCSAVRYVDEDSWRGLIKLLISCPTFCSALVGFFKGGYREIKQRTSLFSNSVCGN